MNRDKVSRSRLGFAGLAAAKALGKAPVDLVVIDQHNYHLFLVAAALSGRDRWPLFPADIASPIR
jgi:hypothetical protein